MKIGKKKESIQGRDKQAELRIRRGGGVMPHFTFISCFSWWCQIHFFLSLGAYMRYTVLEGGSRIPSRILQKVDTKGCHPSEILCSEMNTTHCALQPKCISCSQYISVWINLTMYQALLDAITKHVPVYYNTFLVLCT